MAHRAERAASNYYEVRLQQYRFDDGYTGDRKFTMQKARGRNPDEEDQDNLLPRPDFLGGVKFDLSPVIGETRSAEYVDAGLPFPIGLVVYRLTNNRKFTISAKFVSRNIGEAKCNYFYVNNLRSWLVPDPTNNKSRLSVPPILRLNGYKNQFYNIPVVMTDLNINYPEDVDYVETELAMVPIIQNVEMSLLETHSFLDIKPRADGMVEGVDEARSSILGLGRDFDLELYRNGKLPGY